MNEREFLLEESGISGYLTNHNMTCGVTQNNTTLFLNMDAPDGRVLDGEYKILIYFPDGKEAGALTDDGGKSITAQLYGDNWSLTYVERHPIYKTRVWTLQPTKTYCMEAGESISVSFETIQVNMETGMSCMHLVEKEKNNQPELAIQKFRIPEEVKMTIAPDNFVYGNEISVCFTVTDPQQYKKIEYCGKQLELTKTSFEMKETAACDATYTVSITNQADYKVDSTYSVQLHGLVSFEIENISSTGVELIMKLIKENVDSCILREEKTGEDYVLPAKSGKSIVKMEIKEDKVFYPIVSLQGTTRKEQGEKEEFHMPVIKSFGNHKEDVLEDVRGFLSVKQVREAKIQYIFDCKTPSVPSYTLYYELEHVKKCWLETASWKTEVDVSQNSVTIRTYDRSGTVHAVGDFDYEITKEITW